MNKTKIKALLFIILALCLWLFANLLKHDVIPMPKLLNGPISLLFMFLLATAMIWWGFYDLNRIKKNRIHKKLKEKKLFGIFSKTPSDPIATLSIGQIGGGIMAIGFIIYWIISYGIK